MSTFPRINPGDPRPIYQQIVDNLRRAMVTGVIRPEEQLPSVRELARDLRVNPNTVQHAYRELEREGLVYVRRGQGSFVAAGAGDIPRRAVRLEVARASARAAAEAGLSVRDLIEALEALDEPAEGSSAGQGVA